MQAPAGTSICEALLEHDIDIEHACEMSCACTTCHVVVREGFESLGEMDESEEDLLDRAWGLEPTSRLSCQAILSQSRRDDRDPEVLDQPRQGKALTRGATTSKARCNGRWLSRSAERGAEPVRCVLAVPRASTQPAAQRSEEPLRLFVITLAPQQSPRRRASAQKTPGTSSLVAPLTDAQLLCGHEARCDMSLSIRRIGDPLVRRL